MGSCKITVSKHVFLSLARVQSHRNRCLVSEIQDSTESNRKSQGQIKQRDQNTRTPGGVICCLWGAVQCTLTECEVPWFQSPRAMFCHWVVSWCLVGRQSAFLNDNQLEDSDCLFRLKPGMAETSLIHLAKATAENSSTLWLEIVTGNSILDNWRMEIRRGAISWNFYIQIVRTSWVLLLLSLNWINKDWECRELLIILAKVYVYYLLSSWSIDIGI